jgi:predicted phage tail protein
VLLQDELAEQFGAVHEYHNLRAPVDAIRLLCINYPEFAKHLAESGENGIGYKVVQAGTDLELEDMLLPFGSNDLIIIPVITGSGRGAGLILAGIALIGLAIVTGGVGWGLGGAQGFGALGAAGAKAGFVASAIAMGGNIGIALTLGGISQMLAPTPEDVRFSQGSISEDRGGQSITRGSDGRQSYAMTGPVNSVGLGATIPVCYGKALIGSHIISADIQVTDESDPLNEWIRTPSPETMKVNGHQLPFGTFKEIGGVYGVRYTDNSSISHGGPGDQWIGPSGISIPLTMTGKKYLATIRGEFDEQHPAHRARIAFEMDNGLYSYIAGSGTTKVDGFVTVKVTVQNTEGGAWVGNVQFTAQGLMSPGQSYRWINQFQFGKISHKDWYRVYIEVVDYSADLTYNTLLVRQLGYHWGGPRT